MLFNFCTCCILKCLVCIVVSCLVCIVVAVCIFVMCTCCTVCIAVFTLNAGLLASSQYSEGPATDHLDTGFSRFPCVYKQTLRRFPTFQVATTCFSCSPPDLNLLITNFIFPPGDNPIAVNQYYYYYYYYCTILMKPEFPRPIFEKRSNTKFHVNPSSFSQVVPGGRTDGHDEANSQRCQRA